MEVEAESGEAVRHRFSFVQLQLQTTTKSLTSISVWTFFVRIDIIFGNFSKKRLCYERNQRYA